MSDVKVTSTEEMNKAFREKDGKYREWSTKATWEKSVAKATMVPLIVPTMRRSTGTP